MSNEKETPPNEAPTTTTPNNVVSITAWKNRTKFTESMIDGEPWVPPTERVPDSKPVKKPGPPAASKKKAGNNASANNMSAQQYFEHSAKTSAYVINAYADLIYMLSTAMHEIETGSTDPKIIQIARTTNGTTAKILKQVTIDLGLS